VDGDRSGVNRITLVQVSDTTGDDKRPGAGIIKNLTTNIHTLCL